MDARPSTSSRAARWARSCTRRSDRSDSRYEIRDGLPDDRLTSGIVESGLQRVEDKLDRLIKQVKAK